MTPQRNEKKNLGKKPGDMAVAGFVASPRKKGNCDLLVDEVLKGAKSAGATVEKFFLEGYNLKPCIGCRKCVTEDLKDFCVIKDDMKELYDKFLYADSIVFSFPVYTARESAQAAIFFDRLGALIKPRPMQLATKGRRAAEKLTSKHRIIELFLKEVLKLRKTDFHEEAHRLEHAFSDESIGQIKRLLGNPKKDPHGKPIPKVY